MPEKPHQFAPIKLTGIFEKHRQERYGIFKLFKRWVTEEKETPWFIDYSRVKDFQPNREGGSTVYFEKTIQDGDSPKTYIIDHEVKEEPEEIATIVKQTLKEIYGPQ